jgi:hypothetical protein
MYHPEGKEGSGRDLFRITLREMATARKIPDPDLFAEKLEAWGVKPDDLHAKDVKKRLAKTQLSLADQTLLFSTAERIAEAEKVKVAWNLKVIGPRYSNLSRIVIAAARLSKEIREVFPPPWTDNRTRMGTLIAELAALIEGTFTATTIVDRDYTVLAASAMVRSMRRVRSSKGRICWDLLRELSWLASGKSAGRISDRSLRRYLDDQRRLRSPVWAHLRRNFKLIIEAIQRNPLQKSASPNWAYNPHDGPPRLVAGRATKRQRNANEAFTEIARQYLIASDALDSRTAKPAEKRRQRMNSAGTPSAST